VHVGKTDTQPCPIGAGLDYMAVRGSDPGPFFRLLNGKLLTKSKFTQEVRSAMEAVGLPYTKFAGAASE